MQNGDNDIIDFGELFKIFKIYITITSLYLYQSAVRNLKIEDGR